MTQFAGKVIAVTGAASGIRVAIGKCFGRAGARVALIDMDEEGVRCWRRSRIKFLILN